MVGTTGFITEIGKIDDKLGQLYTFHAVDDSGNSAGTGAIPEKCLLEDKSMFLEKAMLRLFE